MRSSKSAKRPAAKLALVARKEAAFAEVVEMIRAARRRALSAVNTELVDLYWRVGGRSPGRSTARCSSAPC